MNNRIVLDEGALLAGIPALFGFVPSESLIVVALERRSDTAGALSFALRIDIGDITDPDVTAELAQTLKRRQVTDIYGILVTQQHDDDLPYRSHVSALAANLEAQGLVSHRWVHVSRFADGAKWSSYDQPHITGTLPERPSSPLTTAAVLAGQRIFRDRDEIHEQFTQVPADDRTRTAYVVDRVVSVVAREVAVDDRAALRRRLAHLEDAITAAQRGALPGDRATIADLLGALHAPLLRDAAQPSGATERTRAAESLWLHLWRHALPPITDPLIGLVTASAYQYGDGVTARIAAAHASTPTGLAGLVVHAMDAGISPSALGRLLATAADTARAYLHGDSGHA